MNKTGIVRHLDELGRITLPIELRRNLQMEEHEALEILVDGDTIVLRKHIIGDIFTGEKEDLVEFEGKQVSRTSIIKLAQLAGLQIAE